MLLLVALAALRLTGLERHGIGIDEAWDLTVIALPPAQIITVLQHPPNGVLWPPPLHYLVQHAVTRGGDLLPAARMTAAGWNVATLALLLLAARRAPVAVQCAFAALFLLHPFQQYWGQQTRGYAFLQFLTVAAYVALWQWRRSGISAWGMLLAMVLTAGLYTHYYFCLVWLVVALLLLRWQWRRLLPVRAAVWVLLPILLFAPWLPTLMARVTDRHSTGAVRVTQPAVVARELSLLLTGPLLPKMPSAQAARWLALGSGLLLLLLAARRWRRQYWTLLPVLLPLAAAVLVGSQVPTFAARYLIIILVPLYVLLASTLDDPDRRWRRLAVLAVLIHGVGLAYGTAYLVRHEWPLADDYRGAAALIAGAQQPGDVVVCVAPYAALPLRYYLPAVACLDPAALPATGSRRLWLVWSHWQYYDPTGGILTGLCAARPLVREDNLPGVQVFLFGPATVTR